MPELLGDVIAVGGHALEVEDQWLRKIHSGRGEGVAGLLWANFERYYQFIVWRSLLEKYNAQIECGHDGFLVDLVIHHDSVCHLFEMKNWREENTERISTDVRRLQKFRRGGCLLVFSANPRDMTRENVALLEKLDGIHASACIHTFPTENKMGEPYEFWFAGWRINPSA
jgi:hypothetical protein